EAVPLLRARMRDRLEGCRSRDSPALEVRHHGPADLVDLLTLPFAVPVADPADSFAAGLVDDLELLRARLLVASLALGDLLRTLRPPEMLHHRRVAKTLLEQRDVAFPPRLETDAHGAALRRSVCWRSCAAGPSENV